MTTTRTLLLALSLAAAPALSIAADAKAAPAAAAAATEAPANNNAILAEKAKADKKALVATNMVLTDAEAKAFWPIYDEYQVALDGLNKRTVQVIVDYAEQMKKGPATDESANKLIADMLASEQAEVDMRKSFAPKLAKALPAVKAARYLQIENKVRSAVRAQLSARIPLVGEGPKKPQQQQPAKRQ